MCWVYSVQCTKHMYGEWIRCFNLCVLSMVMMMMTNTKIGQQERKRMCALSKFLSQQLKNVFEFDETSDDFILFINDAVVVMTNVRWMHKWKWKGKGIGNIRTSDRWRNDMLMPIMLMLEGEKEKKNIPSRNETVAFIRCFLMSFFFSLSYA